MIRIIIRVFELPLNEEVNAVIYYIYSHAGWISEKGDIKGDIIICLPNKLIIRLN